MASGDDGGGSDAPRDSHRDAMAKTELHEGPPRHDTDATQVSVGGALAAPPASAAIEPLMEGARIGRYLVLERLGAGGMGVVFRAFDPELHREIALKLVHVDPALGRARLLREAQAMAKLAHPNVVPVYDAGTVQTARGEQVYIAMEYVEGMTGAAWARRAARTPREILAVFLDAGRGLEAAHAKGLVHRDFKPENMIVATDGRTRVLDFGLARRAPGSLVPVSARGASELDTELTYAGTVMGTPRYMSPEQHLGRDTDARTDQFSFAVALAELLYGEPPFPGTTYDEVKAAVLAGRMREPSASTKVPAFIRRALVRAMAVEPDARFPSITELLTELARDPDRLKKRALLGGGIVAIVGGAVTATLAMQPGAEEPCLEAGDRLAGLWDDPARKAVRDGFLASGRPYADDAHRKVVASLDAYASAWTSARIEACRATHVRHEQSEALLDLRMRCLDRRAAELGALARVFALGTDPEVVDRAVIAASRLAPLEGCADVEALQAVVAPPTDPVVGPRVEQLRGELARAEALERAGRYRAALVLAQELANEASGLGYPPFLAETLHRRGRLEMATGDATRARATLDEALLAAATARDDRLAAATWPALLVAIGTGYGRPEEALGLRIPAEAALRRSGNGAGTEAELRTALGTVFFAAGKFDDAQRQHEEALAIRERTLGPSHEAVAESLTELAVVLKARGMLDAARDRIERALAILERALGPEHPELAKSLTHLGVIHRLRGDHAEAERHQARALAILERALGPEHPDVAEALNNLGVVRREQGRYAESRAAHVRALAIRERAYGPEHPLVAMSENNLGITARGEGKFAEALRHHQRALEIRERTLGAEHPKVALTLNHLGDSLLRAGDAGEALQRHAQALAIQARSLRADHPERVHSLRGQAAALLALDRPADALAAARRALDLGAAQRIAPVELAETRFVLAGVMWATGDRAGAIMEARAAEGALAGAGALASHAEVSTWLRSHAP
ncbi:MAG: serine/threonine-protein kinase [Kofleriaceae bacterium]|nr:serine/threonine-protein kinase [Kofleriaceae bacterium]